MIPTPTQAPDKHEVRVVRTPVPTKAQLRAQGDAENDPKSMVTARDISSGGLRSPYKSAVAGLVVEGAGTGEVLSDAVASLMHGSEVGAGQHVSARRKLVGEAQGLAPGPSVMPLRCHRSETAGAPWPVSCRLSCRLNPAEHDVQEFAKAASRGIHLGLRFAVNSGASGA